MAMALMKIVPQKTGTAPKAPVAAIWSERIAICGLHSIPKRNSVTGTREKKAKLSMTRERMMPSVVRMARMEQIISSQRRMPSTRLRALNSGDRRERAKAMPAMAAARVHTTMASDAVFCSDW